MENHTKAEAINVYDIGGKNATSAFNHYVQIAAACKLITVKDFVEPAQNFIIRRARENAHGKSVVGGKRKLMKSWAKELMGKVKDQIENQEIKEIIKELTGDVLNELEEEEDDGLIPFELFVPRKLPSDWEQMAVRNFSEAKAHENWYTSDQGKELKCAALIRQSFGPTFRAHVTGTLGGLYETLAPRDIVQVFVKDFVLRMSGDDIDLIKNKIRTLDGYGTVTAAADGLVHLYTSLDVAGVVVHDAERARCFLDSVKTVFGDDAHAALILLPLRNNVQPTSEGIYAFTAYLAGINSVRTDSKYFGARQQSLNAIKQLQKQVSQLVDQQSAKGRFAGSANLGRPNLTGTAAGIVPNPEKEPKLGDSIFKWIKAGTCAFHYPKASYVEGEKCVVGRHTNEQCLRDKSIFNEKYRILMNSIKHKGN